MATNSKFYFRWGVILFFGVLTFVFLAFYADKFGQTTLEVNLGDNKVAIKTSQLQTSAQAIEGLDTGRYYVDSLRKFRFRLPRTGNWSEPKRFKGYKEYFDSMQWSQSETVKQWQETRLNLSPLGKMYRGVEILAINSTESIDVEFTDDTSNEFLDSLVEKIKIEAEKQGTQISDQDLFTYKSQFWGGFKRIAFSNEFSVKVLDKSQLEGLGHRLSLPGFAVQAMSDFGLTIDHLAADARSILGGASGKFKYVKIEGEKGEFRIDRLLLFAENKDYFFVVDIFYSPQTPGSIKIWEELRGMMDSFRIVG